MIRRVLVVLFVACILVQSCSDRTFACSRVLFDWGKFITVIRTFDLFKSDEAKLTVLPRGIARDGEAGTNSLHWTARYGSIAMTAFGIGASDGLNEKGLAVHLLYLHGTKLEPGDNRPVVSNGAWAQYLLDTCATVNEVVSGLKAYRVVSPKFAGQEWPLHLACEDANGDSAIVEFIDGKPVVHHGKQFPVMTNEPAMDVQLANVKRYKLFGGSLAMPGDVDPASRFVRAASYHKTVPEPKTEAEAVAFAMGVGRTVGVPYGAHDTSGGDSVDTWPTLWFTICDLKNGVYYVHTTRTPNIIWLDFSKLSIASGQPVLEVDPYDVTMVGDVSKNLKPKK